MSPSLKVDANEQSSIGSSQEYVQTRNDQEEGKDPAHIYVLLLLTYSQVLAGKRVTFSEVKRNSLVRYWR